MKTLRHALFAGSMGLLSFGCSHNSARTPDTTPSPGLQTPMPSATATPAPAQTTGTTNEPISAPVNDPTITNTPTNSRLGQPQDPIHQPAPVGGPAPSDSTTTDESSPPSMDMTNDSDLTSTPGAQPMNGARDAGMPPSKTPARDGGTGGDAGTKPKK